MFNELCHKSGVLGLDCEWVTVRGSRHRVALLQLAPSTDFAVLLRLCLFKSETASVVLPESLRDILRNDCLLKVGVGIQEDAQKLLLDHNIDVRGCVDLRHIVTLFPELYGFTAGGLRTLSSEFLDVILDKSWRVRCSNWEADVLTKNQIRYAAEDALLSAQIFDQMVRYRIRPRNFFRLGWHERLKQQTIAGCRVAVDVPYRNKPSSASPEKGFVQASSKKLGCFRSYRIRQTPLYDNCKLLAPDGELLCTCDFRKVTWYIDRGLGTDVTDPGGPRTVRLNFEPANRPLLDSHYYTHVKDNVCVVCGSAEALLRKNVVPREYRRNFPEVMKHHISHDVLLLCVRCHQLSNLRDLSLRQILSVECDAPIESGDIGHSREDSKLRSVRAAARALLRNRNDIPKVKVALLEDKLKDYFGVEEITDEIVCKASELDTKVYDEDYVPHGPKVADFYRKNGGLVQLELRWRKHFLESMQPRFLPSFWSVDHHKEVLALKFAQGRARNANLQEIGITQEFVDSVLEKLGVKASDLRPNTAEMGAAVVPDGDMKVGS